MGLLNRSATQEELLSHETQSEELADSEWVKTVHLDDDSDPLSAARGVVVGVLLGGIIWAMILSVLL